MEPQQVAWAQREARLLRRITEAANDTSATPILFARAAADIRRTMDWLAARVVWADDPATAALRPDDVDADDPKLAKALAETGDAWLSAATIESARTGQPCEAPLADPPAALGRASGRTAVALPVLDGDEVICVLEFLTGDADTLDDDLRTLLRNLGGQLGSVAERERVLAELDRRTEELERSNDDLERFAYVASHDLQEPLRKIVGFSELLEQHLGESLDDTGQEYLDYVVDGARRMQQLVKDLLAYSRAGRREAIRVPVDLGSLADDVITSLSWSIEEAGAEVTAGSLPVVLGDPAQLADVLGNLISNAVKYARAGGARVTVSAEPIDDGHAWEILVADDGIGIGPEYHEVIFDVFRRLHGRTEYPGTGIGLAITRRLVEAHGGRIWVTPNDPHGSVFHVTLPAAPQEPA